ncbi:MAG: hypothetical protein ACI4XH_06810, partial [Acutalibacteraceae bacterium]
MKSNVLRRITSILLTVIMIFSVMQYNVIKSSALDVNWNKFSFNMYYTDTGKKVADCIFDPESPRGSCGSLTIKATSNFTVKYINGVGKSGIYFSLKKGQSKKFNYAHLSGTGKVIAFTAKGMNMSCTIGYCDKLSDHSSMHDLKCIVSFTNVNDNFNCDQKKLNVYFVKKGYTMTGLSTKQSGNNVSSIKYMSYNNVETGINYKQVV